MLVKSFQIGGWYKNNIPHKELLPIGTIGFVKCIDGTIRKCKLVSIESCIKYAKSNIVRDKGEWYYIGDKNDESHKKFGYDGSCDWVFNWKVAGYDYLLKGCGVTIANIGTIYATEFSAQHGVSNIFDEYNSSNIETIGIFAKQYGKDILNALDGCQLYTGGSYYFQVYGYYCNKEGKLCCTYAESSIVIDKDGIHFSCPSFDNHTLYKTKSEALQAFKGVEVIDFDDEDDDTNVAVKKVKITIEVEETKVEKVNDFIKNL